MQPKVLIVATSHWSSTARLAMALAGAGCTIEAVCPPSHPLRKTSVVRRIHVYRGIAPLTSVSDAIAAANPDLLIPSDDLAVRHLHQLYRQQREIGESRARICNLITRSIGASASFPVVGERTRFMTAAREEGVLVPETTVVATDEDLRKSSASLGFPFVLKADGTSGGGGVRVVNDFMEAERAFKILQAPPSVTRALKRVLFNQDTTVVWPSLLRRCRVVNAQAHIAGREATSMVACWRGEVLAALHFDVLHKDDSTGPATVMRVIDHPDMSFAAKKMVRRLDLSGLHGFDFMIEAADERAYLIEINPRPTQVGHLALGPGRDLTAALYAALTGAPIRESPAVTDKDVITLFPQEWLRNPSSAYIQSGHHDIPWDEPELVRECVRRRFRWRDWRKWQSQQNWDKARSAAGLPRQ
ncbi:MAG: ATP-grasp domain-containing protein [Candidatus Acidiferrales bacterium]